MTPVVARSLLLFFCVLGACAGQKTVAPEHPWEKVGPVCMRRRIDACGRGWELTCAPQGYTETLAPNPATMGEGHVDEAACATYCGSDRGGLKPCSVDAAPNGHYVVWCDKCPMPPG